MLFRCLKHDRIYQNDVWVKTPPLINKEINMGNIEWQERECDVCNGVKEHPIF
jgi:hypothetical protein